MLVRDLVANVDDFSVYQRKCVCQSFVQVCDERTATATLPPRNKNSTPTRISKENLTPLQILRQLGFPKIRVEKALAATGYRRVQLASDWLLAYVGDPSLDSNEPREYVLYECPTGILAEKLIKFWSESRELGWNGAHNCMPHVTLVSSFKAPDDAVELIADALKNILEQDECPERIYLEAFISSNFIGRICRGKTCGVAQSDSNKIPTSVCGTEADSELIVSQLGAQTVLTRFTISRSSLAQTHAPREHDELDLRPGDYMPEGVCKALVDGWIEGTSWLTGISGYLQLNHTNRTAESDSRTLNASVQITQQPVNELMDCEILKMRKAPVLSSGESRDTTDGVAIDGEPMEASKPPSIPSREIFIVRHGERVDFTFGAWNLFCFEPNGSYIQRDLNLPKELPARNIQDFQNDSPLTTLGEMQASLLGEAMKSSSVKIDVAFSSPSLRCVQTLSQILKGLGSDVTINVEPGLIEWIAWYPNGLPTWMSPDELINSGFNVDKNYKPILRTEDLPARENAAQYYERSHGIVRRMIESTTGNILIVAHAASLAACTRQLVGGRIPPAAEITRLVQRVPYLACLTAREESDGWQIHPPPFPPITHTSNSRFDWKILV